MVVLHLLTLGMLMPISLMSFLLPRNDMPDPEAFAFAMKVRYAALPHSNDVHVKTIQGCDVQLDVSPQCIFAIVTTRNTANEKAVYISVHDGKLGSYLCGVVLPLQKTKMLYGIKVQAGSWNLYEKRGSKIITLNPRLQCLQN